MKMKRIAVLALTFSMILTAFMGMCAISVAAADSYDYELTVSPGRGVFEGGAAELKGDSASITTGDSASLTVGDSTVAITPPDDKHFVTGFKLTGHDNDETYVSSVTVENEDLDLVVKYGMKSQMVKYTVTYNDAGGNQLLASDTFYGVVGDRVHVDFKYVEGYIPNTYSYSGTISDGLSFNFIYYEAPNGETTYTIINDGTVVVGGGGAAGAGGAGAGGAGGAGGAAGAGDGAATIGDGATPAAGPVDNIDIDDQGTPTTDADGAGATDETVIDENGTPTANTNWGLIGGGAAVVAAIAAAVAAMIARRRKSEDGNE